MSIYIYIYEGYTMTYGDFLGYHEISRDTMGFSGINHGMPSQRWIEELKAINGLTHRFREELDLQSASFIQVHICINLLKGNPIYLPAHNGLH